MNSDTKQCVVSRLAVLAAVVVCVAAAAGCGTSSSSNATYTADGAVSPSTTVSGDLLGGSIQKGAFSGRTAPYAATNPAFARFSSPAQFRFERFSSPIAIAGDGRGNMYVANFDAHNIGKADPSGTVSWYSGGGATGRLAGFVNNTTATAATYHHPTAITSDGTALYVADSLNYVIRKIDIATGRVTLLAGKNSVIGSYDAAVDSATFNLLTGITVAGTNLFVIDSGNVTIRMVDMTSNTVTTFAGAPGKTGSADGYRKDARFNQPARIATDGNYLYVTDFGNRTVRRISLATGQVDTIAGIVNSVGTDDGIKGKSRFRGPNGIATDGVNLYVTDFSAVSPNDGSMATSGAIRKITLSNLSTSTIATGLHTPVGIAVDNDSLYVTDRGTHSVIRIR